MKSSGGADENGTHLEIYAFDLLLDSNSLFDDLSDPTNGNDLIGDSASIEDWGTKDAWDDMPSHVAEENSRDKSTKRRRSLRAEKKDLGHVLRKILLRSNARSNRERVVSAAADTAGNNFGPIIRQQQGSSSALPRVLRTDIRREYCRYIATVRNTSNASLANDFVRSFTAPNVTVIMKHPAINVLSTTIGHECAIRWFEYLDRMLPDGILNVYPGHLSAERKGYCAVLTCEVLGRGTLVIPKKDVQPYDANQHIFARPVDDNPTSNVCESQDSVRIADEANRLYNSKYFERASDRKGKMVASNGRLNGDIGNAWCSVADGQKSEGGHDTGVPGGLFPLNESTRWRTVSSNNYTSGTVAAIPVEWGGTMRLEVGDDGRIDSVIFESESISEQR